MKYFVSALSALVLGATFPATAQTAEDFAALPFLKEVEVAPGGQKMSAVFDYQNSYVFGIFDISDGVKPLYTVGEDSELRFRKTEWVRPDRVIFSLKYAGNRYGTDTVETRLFSMNPDGSDITPLFKPPKNSRTGSRLGGSAITDIPIQIQDNIISLLPNDPERILVEYPANLETSDYTAKYVRVDRTGNHATAKSGERGIQNWISDVNGEVIAGTGILNNKVRKLKMLLDNGKWKDLSKYRESIDVFEPVGRAPEPDSFYVLTNYQTDTDALYIFNAATETLTSQVYHNPSSDVLGVELDSRTGKAIGVYLAGDDAYVHWLEDNFIADHMTSLKNTFPNKSVNITDISLDEQYAVVYVDEYNRPGNYFIYDMNAKTMIQLPSQYPSLENASLGEIITTSYTSRDGLTIPAFVTLPPGISSLDAARNLPFVILPHGGPNAREFVGFDYWAQFLATRGYGVLQMNFRGSTGYGSTFQAAGNQQWGQAMQDDISDGVGWLVNNGHADANRVAIMGGSYGGYAALMGAVKTPELYQCAVSFAGVTDLPDIIRDSYDYINGRYYAKYIGRLWTDRKMLAENSPARQADKLSIPVLMFHGEEDRVVSVDQGNKMARALKRAGADYKYIRFDDGDHHLSLYNNRLTFLRETENFLAGCLN